MAITGTAGYENMTRLNDWRGKWDDSSVYLYVLDSSDKDKWMQVQIDFWSWKDLFIADASGYNTPVIIFGNWK